MNLYCLEYESLTTPLPPTIKREIER
jgi:hypothetical protein